MIAGPGPELGAWRNVDEPKDDAADPGAPGVEHGAAEEHFFRESAGCRDEEQLGKLEQA